MEEISDYDLKKIELSILLEFDRICSENNLMYSAIGGTLIGVIRHGGFIPWDDDIDVIMPREDYQKFINLELDNQKYRVLSSKTKGYYYPFAKMVDTETVLIEDNRSEKGIGVFLDIFPIDYVSSKEKKQIIKKNRLKFKKYLLFCAKSEDKKKRLLQNIVQFIFFPFRKKVVRNFEKYNKKLCKNGGDNSYNLSNPVYMEKEWYDFKLFDEGVVRMNFEGIQISCFADYDRVLKKVFGNYEELPPEEKRVTHHSFKAYYKER